MPLKRLMVFRVISLVKSSKFTSGIFPQQRIYRGGIRSRRPQIELESSSAPTTNDPEASEYRYSSVTFLSTLDQNYSLHNLKKWFGKVEVWAMFEGANGESCDFHRISRVGQSLKFLFLQRY